MEMSCGGTASRIFLRLLQVSYPSVEASCGSRMASSQQAVTCYGLLHNFNTLTNMNLQVIQ